MVQILSLEPQARQEQLANPVQTGSVMRVSRKGAPYKGNVGVWGLGYDAESKSQVILVSLSETSRNKS